MEYCKNLEDSIEDKYISIENFIPTENNQNFEDLPKLRGESNNSTCVVVTTITSDNGENVQSCGSVCVFNLQQKLIFNCEYCILKYGDLDNFRRHLHEAHNLFQQEEELEKENDGNARKSSRTSAIVKKEPLEPPIDLPPSYFTKPLVSCGNAFILNQEKFLLACGYCNCSKYENLDMFEKHIKQQHNILEGSHNELNVVPKVEVKDEEFIITELEEAAEIKQNFSAEEGEDENEDENEFIDEFLDEEYKDDDGEYEEEPEDDEESADDEESEDPQSTSEKSKRKRNVFPPTTSSSSSNKSKKTKKRLEEPSKNDEVQCEICHKRLKRRSLYYHRNIHIEETANIHNCQHCEKKFLHHCNLKTHTKLHTGVKLFECEYCEKKFVLGSYLKAHIKSHTGEKSYKCDVCTKHFSSQSNLGQHKKLHMGESAKIYNCQQCDMKFIRSSHLKQHLTIHTGEKPFECDICDYRCRSKRGLVRHKQLHLRESENNFQCEHCEKKLSSDENLRIHLRTHYGEEPFKCDICHKRFRTNSNLKSHKMRHTGETGRIHTCEHCDKNFFLKTDLIIHIHTARHDLPQKCDMCNKRFQSLEKLSDHKKSHIRQGERIFDCEHCEKKFTRSYLKVHLRTHTGEKPYKCEICQKRFADGSNLAGHKKTHMGDAAKTLKCGYCDKTFIRNLSLKMHMGLHTKENPKLS